MDRSAQSICTAVACVSLACSGGSSAQSTTDRPTAGENTGGVPTTLPPPTLWGTLIESDVDEAAIDVAAGRDGTIHVLSWQKGTAPSDPAALRVTSFTSGGDRVGRVTIANPNHADVLGASMAALRDRGVVLALQIARQPGRCPELGEAQLCGDVLVGMDAAGCAEWIRSLDGHVDGRVTVSLAGEVVVALHRYPDDDRVAVFDGHGTLLHDFPVPDLSSGPAALAVSDTGTIVVARRLGIVALDADGNEAWRVDLGAPRAYAAGYITSISLADDGSAVVAGAFDGTLQVGRSTLVADQHNSPFVATTSAGLGGLALPFDVAGAYPLAVASGDLVVAVGAGGGECEQHVQAFTREGLAAWKRPVLEPRPPRCAPLAIAVSPATGSIAMVGTLTGRTTFGATEVYAPGPRAFVEVLSQR